MFGNHNIISKYSTEREGEGGIEGGRTRGERKGRGGNITLCDTTQLVVCDLNA